jgi:hypothetical protein
MLSAFFLWQVGYMTRSFLKLVPQEEENCCAEGQVTRGLVKGAKIELV